MASDILHLKEGHILMARANSGFFEPIAKDIEYINGELQGMEITKGSFLYDFVAFIRFSERKEITSGKLLGQVKDGFLDLPQWVFSLKALDITSRMMAEKLIGVFSRQS